jgi:DNA-binding NtrC family response regulator
MAQTGLGEGAGVRKRKTNRRPVDPHAVQQAIELGVLRDSRYPSAQEIFQALDANGWHAGRASRDLRIGRATLWRRLRAWGVSLRVEKNKRWKDFWFDEKLEQWRKRTGRA